MRWLFSVTGNRRTELVNQFDGTTFADSLSDWQGKGRRFLV